MNVLEKILEEIKERIKKLKEADNMCRVNAERDRNFESVKYFQSLMFATRKELRALLEILSVHTWTKQKMMVGFRRRNYEEKMKDIIQC